MMVAPGGQLGRGPKGTLWGDGHVLSLNKDLGCLGVCIFQTSKLHS